MASIFRKLIADMREERNMTVDQLSSLCGISATVLTAMETGQAKLPFTALIRIMRAFSPSVGAMVLGKHERLSVTYAGEHDNIAVMDGDVKYVPLTSGFVGGHMTPYIIEIGKDISWPDSASDMTGEYFVYVLEGNVEVTLSGETYTVAPGDSVYYDTTVKHSIINRNDNIARLLIVLD